MNKKENINLKNLINLGLTKHEARIYLTLWQRGSLTVKELAHEIKVFPNAIYRLIQRLKQKKMVGILKNRPLTIQAIPFQLAIPNLAKEKALIFQKISAEVTGSLFQQPKVAGLTDIKVIFGQDKIFELGAKMAEKTRKEMLIISIGENIPPNLLLANKRASERGILIKMIAHKYDRENKEILENFKKNGYEIRHFPNKGFHLAVYDSQESLLIINNPQNTEERSAVCFSNPNLSAALRDYFYSVWQKARMV